MQHALPSCSVLNLNNLSKNDLRMKKQITLLLLLTLVALAPVVAQRYAVVDTRYILNTFDTL